MIYFERCQLLTNAIKQINYPNKKLTPGSVYNHILIEQIGENYCEIWMNGGKSLWFSRKVVSTGVVGTKYLAYSNDLERFCNRFPSNKLIKLVQKKLILQIEGLEAQEIGEPIVSDKIKVTLYNGSIDEFKKPELPNSQDLLFSINKELWKSCSQALDSFGDYQSDKVDRSVVFIVNQNLLYIYANRHNSANFYLQLVSPIQGEKDCKFAIKGKYLKHTKGISVVKDIKFYLSKEQIYIESDSGILIVPSEDIERVDNVTIVIKSLEAELEYKGERTLSLLRTIEALQVQEPDESVTWKEITIEEEGQFMSIHKTLDLDKVEASLIPANGEGGWEALSYHANGLKTSLQVIKTLIPNTVNNYINLEQSYKVMSKSQTRWRVVLKPLITEQISLTVCILCQQKKELEYLNDED